MPDRTEPEAPASSPAEAGSGLASSVPARPPVIEAAAKGLRGLQNEDGHWCAELEGDSILESEYALALYFLGLAEPGKLEKLAVTIRRGQCDDGGWANYPGGPSDVSVSVKAYLVLKLTGDDPASPPMTRARDRILDLGGLEGCNSFTKIYLSIFGLFDWQRCPAVPPEMILLPTSFYFNIYAMSSWSRAIVVPLSIIWAHKPVCPLPDGVDLDDLRSARPVPPPSRVPVRERLWNAFFRAVNVGLQLVDRLGIRPRRAEALARAEAWILERLEDSDGVGAIFPPIVNTLIAFRCLDYAVDHPVIQGQLAELAKLEIEEDDHLRMQPCFSPVWDTAIAIDALRSAGAESSDPALRQAARWLIDKEVDRPGDVQRIHPDVPVGGWFFEYRNVFYPDCDDTAEVVKALAGVSFDDPDEERARVAAMDRGMAWLRAMQNDDGGWAAFDRGCDRQILTYVPFADHNAMLDPSTSDITARVTDVLLHCGVAADAPEITKALDFLRREQEEDGSWYGRWGCNYLYGTWLAVQALAAAGREQDQPRLERAVTWLLACQGPEGGWGELPRSYDDPATKGRGPSTAAQTAWALMALASAGHGGSQAVGRGVAWLHANQQPDGTWSDDSWTGTGFPKVFYLRYHLYATYFPLAALGALAHGNHLEIQSGSSARHRAA